MGKDASATAPSSPRRDTARRALQKAYAQHGMTLLVHGLPGMGKTWFLRELLQQGREDERWAVAYITADEIEQNEPYGFVERILAASGVSSDQFDILTDPQVQPVAVGRELVRLHAAGPDGRYLVAIDDAQWIDAESAQVLRYLIPRLTRLGIFVAFGARTPHHPGSLGAHLETITTNDPYHELVHLEPLDVAQIRAMSAERLGATISPRSAERVHMATGGSFLHVVNVFDHLTPAEVSQLHLAWDIPLRGVLAADNPLLVGYQGLSPRAQRTTEIVCLGRNETTRHELAELAARLGEPVEVDEAITAGVLVESGFGATVAPVHALVAHAVRESLAPARARAVGRALAEVTEGYSSVRYRLDAADRLDEDLLTQVRAYVTEAARNRAFDGINSVLRSALALVPSLADPMRRDLLIDLALVNMQNKSVFLLLDLYEDYQHLPAGDLLADLSGIMLAAYHPDVPFPQERVFALVQPDANGPDEATVQAYLAFMLVIMTMRTADYGPLQMLVPLAKARLAAAPRDPDDLADQRLAWMVEPESYTVLLECFDTVQKHRNYDMEATRVDIPVLVNRIHELPNSALKADALSAVAGAAAHTGDVRQARSLADEAVRLLDHEAKPWLAGTSRIILADCLVLHGELTTANELITLTQDITYDAVDLETRPMCAALGATVAAITGQPEARTLAQQAQSLHQFAWEGYGPDFAVLADCEIARLDRDPEAILAVIEAAPVDRMISTRRGFLTFQVHALLDLDRVDEAAELIATLEQWHGTRWAECWGTLAWLRARLARARGELGEAEHQFRAASETTEFPLPHALTLIDHADLLVDMGRADEAGRALRTARTVLSRLGAAAYLPWVDSALTDLRTSGRDLREKVLAALTSREREIAAHLLHGRSNQQIAEVLVVSVATVRFHVSNLLHKLQITSRAEVARVLRGSSLDA